MINLRDSLESLMKAEFKELCTGLKNLKGLMKHSGASYSKKPLYP